MLYFPQLMTGAIVQYPLGKRRIARSVVNEQPDGTVWKLPDTAAALTEWRLELSSLSDDEANALEALFRVVEGRLQTFTFLDPTENLLCWSEKPTAGTWRRGPLLQIVEGITDPWGQERAARLVNMGQAAQRLEQTVDGPDWYTYCVSLYARSDVEAPLRVCRTSAEAEDTLEVRSGPDWRRIVWPTTGRGTGEGVAFGVELAAGSQVDVAGLQVEAQPGASPYRRTTARGGVHRACRFGQDTLSFVTEGPNQHSCKLAVLALPEDRN